MTVTVALPGDTAVGDLWAALEAALAPYDENIDVDPYVRYSTVQHLSIPCIPIGRKILSRDEPFIAPL